jgi:D-alanyl-lipoteichoic acid acyltransferase DltB (MBOAT superfamily)
MVDEETLRFCYGMFALVPLSFSLKFFGSARSRYLYSTFSALLLQLSVYGSLMLPIYFQHLIVYAIVRASPRRCGAVVTFESMAFLSAYHIYEHVTNYGGWRMNAVSLLMILVCKYSLLAYDLQDGAASPEKLSEEQRRNRIARDITFLEFMGYVNFLPTCLLGPPLEFNDYHNFIAQNEEYSAIPDVTPITITTLAETGLFAGLHLLGDIYIPAGALKTD